MKHPGEVSVVVEHGWFEEVCFLEPEGPGAGIEEDADVLQAEELRHLRTLVHRPHVNHGVINHGGNVAQKDAVPMIQREKRMDLKWYLLRPPPKSPKCPLRKEFDC